MSLFADRFDSFIKLLGRGGIAEVWLAEQKGIRGRLVSRVVIKQMLSHLAEDRDPVRRFEDEARVAALMNTATSCGWKTLVRRAASRTSSWNTSKERTLWCSPSASKSAASGSRHGWSCRSESTSRTARRSPSDQLRGRFLNVVHRDVSPQNIMVDLAETANSLTSASQELPRIRSRRAPGSSKEKSLILAQNRVAASPLMGAPTTQAAVLWELLTGHRLFLAQTDVDTPRRVRRGEIPPLRDYLPEASDLLVECVQKVLHQNLLQRFADGNALRNSTSSAAFRSWADASKDLNFSPSLSRCSKGGAATSRRRRFPVRKPRPPLRPPRSWRHTIPTTSRPRG